MTPVSNIVFYALSSGTFGFALHGSFNNHLHERICLAVEEFPPIKKWLKKTARESKTEGTIMKEHKKLYKKLVPKVTIHFV